MIQQSILLNPPAPECDEWIAVAAHHPQMREINYLPTAHLKWAVPDGVPRLDSLPLDLRRLVLEHAACGRDILEETHLPINRLLFFRRLNRTWRGLVEGHPLWQKLRQCTFQEHFQMSLRHYVTHLKATANFPTSMSHVQRRAQQLFDAENPDYKSRKSERSRKRMRKNIHDADQRNKDFYEEMAEIVRLYPWARE